MASLHRRPRQDTIVTGGFNVFPGGRGRGGRKHPAAAQVCVAGAPDEKWGEAVTAVVVAPNAARDEPAIEAMTAEIQASGQTTQGSVQCSKGGGRRLFAVDRSRKAGQEASCAHGQLLARGRLAWPLHMKSGPRI